MRLCHLLDVIINAAKSCVDDRGLNQLTLCFLRQVLLSVLLKTSQKGLHSFLCFY